MAIFLWSLPATFLLMAVAMAWASPSEPSFRVARAIAAGVALATWGGAALWWIGGAESSLASPWMDAPAWSVVRVDGVTFAMLSLVHLVAFAILSYSGPYLHGDPRGGRYLRWMAVALAGVGTLVITDHLLVVSGAWLATSVALHRLLLHFADRPAAQLAAHKKFLASRTADLALLAAVGLIYAQTGSLSMQALGALTGTPLPGTLQVAALLLVVCVVLKTAQVPFHGWITQVMEAPTPVSALLHAGVVNIGGFMMIRLAPLMTAAPVAQTVLVVVGSTTAVIAGFVMTSRVSVKVMLAWSTIAQMGFMLVQCGLGAYGMALLHIVAHSLYKAHAFLSSGSAVDVWRIRQLVPAGPRWTYGRAAVGLVVSAAIVGGVGALWGVDLRSEPALGALTWVLLLALVPLDLGRTDSVRGFLTGAVTATGVAGVYFAWHAAVGALVPASVEVHSLAPRVAVVVLAFGGAFAVRAGIDADPTGAVARALQPRLFAGFHLDERFTRLVLRVWPPASTLEIRA